MTTLTTNQTAALELFYADIVEYSDFENHNYFSMSELLTILVKNGWERKSAEGTVGSLLASDECRFYEEQVDGGHFIYTLWIADTHPLYEEE